MVTGSSCWMPLLRCVFMPACRPHGYRCKSATVGRSRLPEAPKTEAFGERRHLTVLFCDLVGSTEISAQLDAEEWRDLVSEYLDAASAAVTEMGGHVAKKLGDGLMALFGYPFAQENDAPNARPDFPYRSNARSLTSTARMAVLANQRLTHASVSKLAPSS